VDEPFEHEEFMAENKRLLELLNSIPGVQYVLGLVKNSRLRKRIFRQKHEALCDHRRSGQAAASIPNSGIALKAVGAGNAASLPRRNTLPRAPAHARMPQDARTRAKTTSGLPLVRDTG